MVADYECGVKICMYLKNIQRFYFFTLLSSYYVDIMIGAINFLQIIFCANKSSCHCLAILLTRDRSDAKYQRMILKITSALRKESRLGR